MFYFLLVFLIQTFNLFSQGLNPGLVDVNVSGHHLTLVVAELLFRFHAFDLLLQDVLYLFSQLFVLFSGLL